MTIENKETGFDVRHIRPTIQFITGKPDTTETRLEEARERMTFTRAKHTIRRTGWYFTEPSAPCGKFDFIAGCERLTTMFGNEKDWIQHEEHDENKNIYDEHTSMEEIKASIASVFGA